MIQKVLRMSQIMGTWKMRIIKKSKKRIMSMNTGNMGSLSI